MYISGGFKNDCGLISLVSFYQYSTKKQCETIKPPGGAPTLNNKKSSWEESLNIAEVEKASHRCSQGSFLDGCIWFKKAKEK